MSSMFVSSYPSWLSQPSIVQNVFSNSFSPIKDVPAALTFSDTSSFMSGLRQALFWRRRLTSAASSFTAIFSFLGVGGLTSPNLSEIYKALRNVNNISSPVEVYRAFNSPFIGISFSDSSSASIFRSLCCSFKDLLIIHVTPSAANSHSFKLIGLPPLFPDSRIHHFLSKHSASHTFIRESISLEENVHLPLNSVIGTLQLKSSQTIDQLPHLIPLPPPHQNSALLIINGRQSLCLRCGGLGHLRRHCVTPRCSSCKRYHPTLSSCTSTFLQDSSLNIDWLLEDSSLPSSLSDLPTISSSPPEYERTHESSSLKSPSSISVSSSFSKVASSGSFSTTGSLSSSAVIDTSISTSSNVAMPSNLFEASSIFHPKTTDPNASQHADFTPVTSLLITKHKEVVQTIKQAKKATLASKRFRSQSSSSSSTSLHQLSSSNIYASLEDEILPNNEDIIPTQVPSSLLESAAIIVSDQPISIASDTSMPLCLDPQLSSVSTVSHSTSHKKSKKSRKSAKAKSSSISSPSTLHQPPALKDSDPSWGEIMDEESETFAFAKPNNISSPPLNPASSSFDQIITADLNISLPAVPSSSKHEYGLSISSLTIEQDSIISDDDAHFSSNSTLHHIATSSSSDTDTYDGYSDCDYSSSVSDSIIFLKGLPLETSIHAINKYLGEPYPSHICLSDTNNDPSSTYHVLFFSKDCDYQHVLDRDGTWHLGKIISVTIKRKGRLESQS